MKYFQLSIAMHLRTSFDTIFRTLFTTAAAGLLFVSSAFGQSDTYRVDVEKSVLSWEGHRFFGGMHTGNIDLRDGALQVAADKLTGGSFRIDMNSIVVTDVQGDPAERLAAHLKTEDFFDAGNHPVATFRLKHIDYAGDRRAAIVGDITIRGITQQISFPAEIAINDGKLHAVAAGIRVDRTVHGSQYGSVSFFRDLGRKIVNDEFVLNVELFAKKQ